MIAKTYLLALLSGLALLVCGCTAHQNRPYVSLPDKEQARLAADLVVEGEVTETFIAERRPVNTFAADSLVAGNPVVTASSNMDCLVKTRATMKVAQVTKASSAVPDRVQFWYESPCYANDPSVLLGTELPAALNHGDLLRAYLVSEGGQYWLIAHEPWRPAFPAPVVGSRLYKLPGPDAREFTPPATPVAPAPAPAAGVEGAVPPETAAPPGTTATPPETATPPPTPTPPPATPVAPGPPTNPSSPAARPTPPNYSWQVPAPPGAPNYNPHDRWWPPPK